MATPDSENPSPRPPFASEGTPAEQLATAIRWHNDAYFNKGQPVVSDADFDALVARLRALEPEHPVLGEVGAPVVGPGASDKVKHKTPMLSLEKCTSVAEFEFWSEGIWETITGEVRASRIPVRGSEAMIESAVGRRHEQKDKFRQWMRDPSSPLVVATPKVDGLACSLRYDSAGTFYLGATRGDGQIGEDVTHNVAYVQGVPARIRASARNESDVEVRGEVYLPLSVFSEFAEMFANPRNLAAGTLKSKEVGEVSPSQLRFVAYDLLGLEVETEREKASVLEQLGFETPLTQASSIAEAATVFESYLHRSLEWDFEADGVVFKFDDLALQRRLGLTEHHPRGAIAWKFNAVGGLTTLVDVEWSVSRTSTITPVAIVAPVQLSGATVTRATLHNVSNLRKLGLKIGDTVELVRRGGVIPHLERTLGGGTEIVVAPSSCPACGAPTETVETTRVLFRETLTTVLLLCKRPGGCTHAKYRQILHYCSVLDMFGFGEKAVEALIVAGLVSDAADLYTLNEGDLQLLPHVGPITAANLVEQARQQRQIELPKFLRALGIPALGKRNAEIISQRWTLNELRVLTPSDLATLPGLGRSIAAKKNESTEAFNERRKIATSIVDGLRDAAPLIDRLLKHVTVYVKAPELRHSGPLAGQVVVFTGKLQQMLRRDAQQRVVQLGGLAGDSVTAETTQLVVAADELQAPSPSAKLKKARKLQEQGAGIEIVPEAEFWRRLAEREGA